MPKKYTLQGFLKGLDDMLHVLATSDAMIEVDGRLIHVLSEQFHYLEVAHGTDEHSEIVWTWGRA